MRIMRTIGLGLVFALAACGSTTDSADSPTPGKAGASVAVPSNTSLPAPEALDGWQVGNLCTVVTADVAAKALGKPVTMFAGENSLKDPDQVDACNYVYNGPNDEGIDKVFTANVVVKKPARGVDSFDRATRAELILGQHDVTDFTVPGMDQAFYGHFQAFVVKGDIVVAVNNGATGRFAPDKLVGFAALVAATVS